MFHVPVLFISKNLFSMWFKPVPVVPILIQEITRSVSQCTQVPKDLLSLCFKPVTVVPILLQRYTIFPIMHTCSQRFVIFVFQTCYCCAHIVSGGKISFPQCTHVSKDLLSLCFKPVSVVSILLQEVRVQYLSHNAHMFPNMCYLCVSNPLLLCPYCYM
jgi:hypothetical protein